MTTEIESLFDSFLIEDEDDIQSLGSLDVNTVIVRARYILDGASSLEDAADMARAYADYLDGLKDQGYELVNMIQDDKGLAAIVD